MRTETPGRILRVHISESDLHQGQPLYEAIVARCRELGMAGATVLAGLEGFGETAELHRGHLMHSHRPMVVTVVDTAENLARLIAAIEPMMHTGLIATSAVTMIRVEK